MKTIKQKFLSISIAALLLTAFLPVHGQDAILPTGTTNSIKIEKPFDAIDVGGSVRVFLIQGEEQLVQAEYPDTLDMLKLVQIDDNTLSFSTHGIKKPDKLKIYVTFKTLTRLESSGASNVKGMTPIKAEHFNLEASGAAKVEMEINCTNLVAEASGAADVKFSGKTDLLSLEATGASNMKALELAVSKASVEISGASNVRLDVRDEITGETSGAAKLTLKQMPKSPNLQPSGVSKIYIGDKMTIFGNDENKDKPDESQIIELNNNKTITIDENGVVMKSDSGAAEPLIIDDNGVKVIIKEKVVDGKTQRKVLVINDEGIKVIEKEEDNEHHKPWNKKEKFNGHWGGLELGVNGFVDKDNSTTLPNYEFLDLKMEKSINVKFNLFEQNINLIRHHFGLVTGLGLEYVNYRFNNNVNLIPDTSAIAAIPTGDLDPTKSYTKSKLVVNYLNLPIIFEYQTNGKDKTNSFHIAAGMIFGWRIGSHSKNIISDTKLKNRDDFSLEPFKYDLTARIGWGIINLNATYALNTLFRDKRGPEVYPFSLGLTIVNF